MLGWRAGFAFVLEASAGCAGGTTPLAEPAPSHDGYVTGPDQVRLFYRTAGSHGDTLVFLHGGPGEKFQGVGPDLEALAQGHWPSGAEDVGQEP